MRVYKLTDQNGYTRRGLEGETKWGEGVTHIAVGEGAALCTDGVIHYYEDPALALFMNPVHANLTAPVVWEAEIPESVITGGLNGGAKRLTTLRVIQVPKPTTEQCVRFGILCSLEVSQCVGYREWANRWLDGTDRSVETAEAKAVEWSEESIAAAWSTRVALMAATAWAENRVWVPAAAAVAADAAEVAARAKRAVIDLPSLAKKAMEFQSCRKGTP